MSDFLGISGLIIGYSRGFFNHKSEISPLNTGGFTASALVGCKSHPNRCGTQNTKMGNKKCGLSGLVWFQGGSGLLAQLHSSGGKRLNLRRKFLRHICQDLQPCIGIFKDLAGG